VSWRPIVAGLSVCGLAFVVALAALAAFADMNENPHELLSKSFQQADLWSHGPVKIVAKFPMYRSNGQIRTRQYTVF
jgi:hypothetical protein